MTARHVGFWNSHQTEAMIENFHDLVTQGESVPSVIERLGVDTHTLTKVYRRYPHLRPERVELNSNKRS